MDREWLARRLDEGASYEEPGRELGCSASKVSCWAAKRGLTSAHARRHPARGGIDEHLLRQMVSGHFSIRVAETMDRRAATIRHHLARLGFETDPGRHSPAASRAAAPGRRGDDAFLRPARNHPACAPRCGLPLRDLPRRRRDGAPTARQADPGRGGGRLLRPVRIRPLQRGAAFPPSRSSGKELRGQRRRGDPFPRGRARRRARASSSARTATLKSKAGWPMFP